MLIHITLKIEVVDIIYKMHTWHRKGYHPRECNTCEDLPVNTSSWFHYSHKHNAPNLQNIVASTSRSAFKESVIPTQQKTFSQRIEGKEVKISLGEPLEYTYEIIRKLCSRGNDCI